MYTLSFILLAFQLVYCCVLVVLLLYILINSKRMELFSIITMNSIPVPEPLPHKSKPLKTNTVHPGRSRTISTRHKHPIPQQAYPRYRVSRLKGAKNRVKPRRKVMTLYTLRTALQRERYPVKPYKGNPGQRPGKIAK